MFLQNFVYQFDSLDKLHLGLYGSSQSFGGAAAYTIGWKHADTRFGSVGEGDVFKVVSNLGSGD